MPVGPASKNGPLDGWSRPYPSPAWVAGLAGGSQALYPKRGIAYRSRYMIFWTGTPLLARRRLVCTFDDIDEARRFIASRPDARATGIWDRRENRWREVAE